MVGIKEFKVGYVMQRPKLMPTMNQILGYYVSTQQCDQAICLTIALNVLRIDLQNIP